MHLSCHDRLDAAGAVGATLSRPPRDTAAVVNQSSDLLDTDTDTVDERGRMMPAHEGLRRNCGRSYFGMFLLLIGMLVLMMSMGMWAFVFPA